MMNEDNVSEKICPACNKNELEELMSGFFEETCSACSYAKIKGLEEKEKKLKERKKYLEKEREAKTKAESKIRRGICKRCEKTFELYDNNQKYCHNPCTPKMDNLLKANEAWLKRDEKKLNEELRVRNRKCNNLAKLGWKATEDDKIKKRFTACRG